MDYAKISKRTNQYFARYQGFLYDMVVKACAMALKKHPQVNTSWNNDTTR